jgi:hypothetical protein
MHFMQFQDNVLHNYMKFGQKRFRKSRYDEKCAYNDLLISIYPYFN